MIGVSGVSEQTIKEDKQTIGKVIGYIHLLLAQLSLHVPKAPEWCVSGSL